MQCVVLAAGEGKRMRPLTARRPKVMLPVANRPMMEHAVLAARDAGITEFIFVVGYGEHEIRSHFGAGAGLGVEIRYVAQRRQRGTADALLAAAGSVSDRFLLINGDMIIKSADIERISRMEAPCMGVTHTDHPRDYGAVTVSGGCITGIEEKPAHPAEGSGLINAGMYLLEPGIFDHLEALDESPRGEFELTDALLSYIREGDLRAYDLEFWIDVGYPWDLLDANEALLAGMAHTSEDTAHHPPKGSNVEEGVTIRGGVTIGEGTVVRSGTYIEGPCIIGSDCRVGPHAYIRGPASIGDGCHIGHATEIKNSVIMAGTKIPHFNYIGDSVIGADCNIGAGTKIANLRHDRQPVKVCGVSTRRMKFGAVIGDRVQFGINCSVNTGSLVGSFAKIAPHSYIDGCIEDGAVIR